MKTIAKKSPQLRNLKKELPNPRNVGHETVAKKSHNVSLFDGIGIYFKGRSHLAGIPVSLVINCTISTNNAHGC